MFFSRSTSCHSRKGNLAFDLHIYIFSKSTTRKWQYLVRIFPTMMLDYHIYRKWMSMISFALFSKDFKSTVFRNDPLPSGTYPTHFLEAIPTGMHFPEQWCAFHTVVSVDPISSSQGSAQQDLCRRILPALQLATPAGPNTSSPASKHKAHGERGECLDIARSCARGLEGLWLWICFRPPPTSNARRFAKRLAAM